MGGRSWKKDSHSWSKLLKRPICLNDWVEYDENKNKLSKPTFNECFYSLRNTILLWSPLGTCFSEFGFLYELKVLNFDLISGADQAL